MLSTDSESTRYITQCEEDEDGNLILTFPDELLDTLDWHEGDELEFDVLQDRITMRRVSHAPVSADC
jgi:bifunctional DNA-binding transcriptional regulator/antitoxin component of YhaV-PrlF toxin-antitoxin module